MSTLHITHSVHCKTSNYCFKKEVPQGCRKERGMAVPHCIVIGEDISGHDISQQQVPLSEDDIVVFSFISSARVYTTIHA